jgi:hypothetical protein
MDDFKTRIYAAGAPWINSYGVRECMILLSTMDIRHNVNRDNVIIGIMMIYLNLSKNNKILNNLIN